MLAEVISCPLCLNANASDGEFTIAVFTACLCEDHICGISEDCFPLSEHRYKPPHSEGHNVGICLLSQSQKHINARVKGQERELRNARAETVLQMEFCPNIWTEGEKRFSRFHHHTYSVALSASVPPVALMEYNWAFTFWRMQAPVLLHNVSILLIL